MKRLIVCGMIGVMGTAMSSVSAADYATQVLSYVQGSGSLGGLTDSSAALGEPSRVTSGTFGGPVDPFSPPYLGTQLVSIGAGGHILVQFASPIQNAGANPFGIDFMIFGNSGFDTGPDFNGIANGSLFGNSAPASTEVFVSADNVNFHRLNPSLAPVVDGLFPTDGSGDFGRAVNPALQGSDFVGNTLAGLRSHYNGSAGGTGYDISWAEGPSLSSIQYVRINVITGVPQVDGFSVVNVPEPGTFVLGFLGAVGVLIGRRKR